MYGYTFVKTNGDVTSYLNEKTETSIGKEMLEGTFEIMGDATIAMKGVSDEKLKKFVSELEGLENVKQVLSLGRFDSMVEYMNDPETLPAVKAELEKTYNELKNKFYDSQKDISSISIYFTKASSSDEVIALTHTIEDKLIAMEIEEFSMTGTAINARNLLESSIGEIPKFLIIAVIIILIILLFTSKSIIEPIIFLVTLGISILLNMGSNIVLGEISSITFSASTILQLALAMDYAVFLMHSFNEELKVSISAADAMKSALPKTLKSVLASALTTVGGFVALFFMQFGMGLDLGVVLAKGVILSLLSVITLQPVLILICNKLIIKTTHKQLNMNLSFINKISDRSKKPIIIVALLLVLPSFIMQYFVDISYLTMVEPKSEVTVTEAYLEDTSNQIIMMVPYSFDLQSKKGFDFLDKIKSREDVSAVFTLGSIISREVYLSGSITGNPLIKELETNFVAKNPDNKTNYVLYIINIKGEVESAESYAALNEIKTLADETFGQVYTTGLAQGAYDLSLVTLQDFVIVSIISALIIFLILLIGFKSFTLSTILLLVIELGIWVNLSITYMLGVQINFMAYIIISAIQLGATVDYAILLTYRFKDEKAKGLSHKEAINEAVIKVGPSIVVSAAILIFVCIGVRMVTTNLIVAQITELIARGAFMSLVLVLVLLPSIMKTVQEIIEKKANKKDKLERKSRVEQKRLAVESKKFVQRKH